MSLKDTIEAAKQEVAESGGLGLGTKKDAAEDEKKTSTKAGRRSAASSKPTRAAGASVRVSSGKSKTSTAPTEELTKEERKEKRREERAREDLKNQAYRILLKRNDDYQKTERLWWIILGGAFLLTILSLALYYLFPGQSETMQGTIAYVSIGALVGAYVLIIGGFIFDFVKRRPVRNEVQAQVDGMTDKRLYALFEQERERREAEEK